MARILVLAGYAPSLLNFRGPLLRALRQAGHEVTATAPEEAPAVAAALGEAGIAYTAIPVARAGIDPRGDLRYFLRMWREMRSRRPGLVLAYTVKPVTYGLIAARLAGVKNRAALITGLGYAFMEPQSLRQRLIRAVVRGLYRWALRGARCIFFQNPDDRAEFERLGILRAGDPVHIVNGSGVDLAHYAQTPPPAAPVFLLIARLLRDKGIAEYAAAAAQVRARHPAARFLLVGGHDPNPAAIAQTELDAWVASGAIEYLGQQGDVRPALDACAVYVLPSYREGTPRTVLEAMAKGRAIITTDAPGCRETVVDGDNGFLVPVRSAEALAQAMLRFIDEPALAQRMGLRSRQIAEDKYDVNKVNDAMIGAMHLS